jgi:hypothetical protein
MKYKQKTGPAMQLAPFLFNAGWPVFIPDNLHHIINKPDHLL